MNRHYTLLCALLLALTLAGGALVVRRTSAQAQTPPAAAANTVSLAGLRAPVTIRRDERGIPHITAQSDADLYFAQGYAAAQDRLWQMDLLRRTARGELAEIFGNTVLEEDKRHRVYGFAVLADGLATHLTPESRAVLDAYAAGVNAYAESLDAKSLPPEFQILQYKPRPWRPADSIIIGKVFAETLSTTWQLDLMRAALADLPREQREILLTEYTPLDTVVVGNDQDKAKRAAQTHPPAPVAMDVRTQGRLLDELTRINETTARSLARVGLYLARPRG